MSGSGHSRDSLGENASGSNAQARPAFRKVRGPSDPVPCGAAGLSSSFSDIPCAVSTITSEGR